MGISKRTEQQADKYYQRELKRDALMLFLNKKAAERRIEDKTIEFMLSRSAVKGVAYDRKGSGGNSEPMMQEDYLIEQKELEEAVENARRETNRVRQLIFEWTEDTGESKGGLLRLRYIRGMDVGFIALMYGWTRKHTENMIRAAIDALPPIPAGLDTCAQSD